MEHFIEQVTDFIHLHKDWAILIMGLTALGESLFIVGIILPATPILLAVGGLIAADVIDPVAPLAAAIIGAVVGDIISYIIGRKFGWCLIATPIGKRYRRNVAKGRVFSVNMERWQCSSGGFSVR